MQPPLFVDAQDEQLHPDWFAVLVRPRHEKSVSRLLESKGTETFVPVYRASRSYGKRIRTVELPLFPGYVFSRFVANNRLPVMITPGVVSILGAGREPLPVDEAEIDSLRTVTEQRLTMVEIPYLEVGKRVRISQGPLAGVEGTVLRAGSSVRVVLSVSLLQRSVAVEVESNSVQAQPEEQ